METLKNSVMLFFAGVTLFFVYVAIHEPNHGPPSIFDYAPRFVAFTNNHEWANLYGANREWAVWQTEAEDGNRVSLCITSTFIRRTPSSCTWVAAYERQLIWK
jgi:hypothetical protein